MSYKTIFLQDQLLFVISEGEVIQFSSSQDVKRLISSGTTLEELIEFVNNSILTSLEEEIEGINNVESLEQKLFIKTAAYAKLLMPIGEYAKMKKFEQEQLALKERAESDWTWTGQES
jgi:hypothetical protein